MRGVSVLCAPWGLRGNSSESRQSTTFSEERTIRREMRLRPRFLSYTVIHDYASYAIDRPLILVGLRKKKKKKKEKHTFLYANATAIRKIRRARWFATDAGRTARYRLRKRLIANAAN